MCGLSILLSPLLVFVVSVHIIFYFILYIFCFYGLRPTNAGCISPISALLKSELQEILTLIIAVGPPSWKELMAQSGG